MFSDCGNSAAEVVARRRNNRVTVTVRQDGREIVCPLSAVTVFLFSGIFLNRSKTVLFAWFNRNENFELRTGFVFIYLYAVRNFEISATKWH